MLTKRRQETTVDGAPAVEWLVHDDKADGDGIVGRYREETEADAAVAGGSGTAPGGDVDPPEKSDPSDALKVVDEKSGP